MANERRADPEVAEVPGLEEYVALSHLIDAITAIRDVKFSEIRPAISMFWVEEVQRGDDFPKTFIGVEGRATANLTLKKRTIGKTGLTRDDITRLGAKRIPLRTTGAGLTVNKDYLEDQQVLSRLRKLLAANPDADIPPDFLSRLAPKVMPDEDTQVRVLRLPPTDAVDLLDTVGTIVVSRTTIDGKDVLRRFAGKLEAMLAAEPVKDDASEAA